MNNSIDIIPQKATLKFAVNFKDKRLIFSTEGRYAQTLYALAQRQKEGITSLEVNSWAYRLASYVHTLRNRFNLDIITKFEEHEGGKHARYFLYSDVEIIDID